MYVFYNIQHFILLSKLQLLEAIHQDGHRVITSTLRLSYYSGPRQLEVLGLVEKGFVQLHEHPDDLFSFMEAYADVFPQAGKGLLILIHLCRTSGSTLVIEDDQAMVKDIAVFFEVSTMAVKDFYQQTIKNQQYHQFLLAHH